MSARPFDTPGPAREAQKDEPRTEREKMAIEFLRNDSQARVAFIDKVAAPILNKMFECGLIP